MYNFLWNGPDNSMSSNNDTKCGGLRLTDLKTSIKSLRLAWLGRIFFPGSAPWKAYINHLLENYGGIFLFSCNYDVKNYNIDSAFYSEFLQWWADFRNVFSTKPLISESIIWNSRLIKIDGESVYYKNYVEAEIIFINQLQFIKDDMESCNIAKKWRIEIHVQTF